MFPETNWRVITAGPSAGKSTTINAISYLGYETSPEVARMWIDELISRGKNPDDYLGTQDFQNLILETQLQMEAESDKSSHLYMDRSLIDAIAYNEFFGLDVDDRYYEIVRDRYSDVYVLEQLPFDSDYARHEDPDEAEAVHEKLIETYEALGYEPTRVPVTRLGERVNKIVGEYAGLTAARFDLY